MNCPKHKDREVVAGRSRCQECLDRLKVYQKKRREKFLSENRCVGTVTRSGCTNQPRPGKTMCEECAVVFNTYQLKRLEERKAAKGGEAQD